MNYLDIILVIPIVWYAYKGLTKGFIIEIASLIALLLGIQGSIKFSEITSLYVRNNFELNPEYVPILSFSLTFIIIVVAVRLLAKIIDKIVKAAALGIVNRLVGMLFGVVKIAFIMSILLIIIDRLSFLSIIKEEDKNTSVLYDPLRDFSPLLFDFNSFDYTKFLDE